MDHQEAIEQQFVERYLLDELGPSERDSFEAHLFDCPQCAEALRAASIFEDEARGLLRDEFHRPTGAAAAGTGLPGGGWLSGWSQSRSGWSQWRSGWSQWIRGPVLIPACAALLLCVVGYQNLIQIPAMRASRVVPAFALIPVTRGDDQVLKLPAGAGTVVLTIDLTVPSPGGYRFEFNTEQGQTWLVLQEKPPAATDSLSLQLDAARVPLGRHLLSVRSADGGDELMRFRFVTEKP
jgi:hypothetical protein